MRGLLDLDLNIDNFLDQISQLRAAVGRLERHAATGVNTSAFMGRNNPTPGLFQANGGEVHIGLRENAGTNYLDDPDAYAINIYGNRVGINTKYPSEKVLHIAGDAGDPAIIRMQYSNDEIPITRTDLFVGVGGLVINSYSDSGSVYKPIEFDTSYTTFYTGQVPNRVLGLYIDATGKVGIGRAPGQDLTVTGRSGFGGVIRVQYSNDNTPTMRTELIADSGIGKIVVYKDTVTAQYKPLEINAESFEIKVATTGALVSALTVTSGGDVYSEPETDYSATSTITGWSSFTTKVLKYKRFGNLMLVWFDIGGTSDTTTASFTLPYAQNMGNGAREGCQGEDNGVFMTTPAFMDMSGATVSVYKDYAESNLWTNSGTKRIIGKFWYLRT